MRQVRTQNSLQNYDWQIRKAMQDDKIKNSVPSGGKQLRQITGKKSKF